VAKVDQGKTCSRDIGKGFAWLGTFHLMKAKTVVGRVDTFTKEGVVRLRFPLTEIWGCGGPRGVLLDQ